jgi:2-polyprenyl-3-methyl-5-hydroxy-6-metoxy-1,4-benzoquinol methylase
MSRLRDKLIQQYAEHYARTNEDINPTSMQPQAFAALEATFGPALDGVTPGARVLDVGCGTGFLLYWLWKRGGVAPVGVDASRTQIAVLKQHLPEIEVHCADGLSFMRQHPGTFEVIFCTDVLEHIPDEILLDWVETARAALTPGGAFVCRVPNASNLTAAQARYIDLTHERCFTVQSLTQLLDTGGFSGCRILPIRLAHLSGRVRLLAEQILHRAVYRICGDAGQRVFTSNIVALARRPQEAAVGERRAGQA